ncbi:hypothetical protein [Paracoccus sp. AK26]|uniref:hypothetical protein n=1 Tax=Paracoccus sp. AK26 TaxID=2589076 RepID=UPI00142F8249|nr:hypothetical protein [Paracoccus sp. AK26]
MGLVQANVSLADICILIAPPGVVLGAEGHTGDRGVHQQAVFRPVIVNASGRAFLKA